MHSNYRNKQTDVNIVITPILPFRAIISFHTAMKILTLYSTSVQTTYKNSICSCAAVFVFLSSVFIVIAPMYLIVYTSNDLWYQPKIFYEQPTISFQYKYILMGEHDSSVDNIDYSSAVDGSTSLAVMSSFGYFNEITESLQKRGTVRVNYFENVSFRSE